MSEAGLLDQSPDLVKIRPIYLKETDVQQLAECWRSCTCCRELLEQQAVQMACCDTIYHVHCMRGFAKHKALSHNGTSVRDIDFFCPWCNVALCCKPSHVWSFLEECEVSAVLESGANVDKWLSHLSTFSTAARVEFMLVADEYERTGGNPSGAMQLPLRIDAVRRFCKSQPAALEAFETLYEERDSSFEALLQWDASLIREEDLEDVKTSLMLRPFMPWCEQIQAKNR